MARMDDGESVFQMLGKAARIEQGGAQAVLGEALFEAGEALWISGQIDGQRLVLRGT